VDRKRFRTWALWCAVVLVVLGVMFAPSVEVVLADGPVAETAVTVEPTGALSPFPPDGGGSTEGFAWGD
jgi:hypothetical protein